MSNKSRDVGDGKSEDGQPETGFRKSAPGLVVDLVNPKFRAFNRPLLLALLVGLVTVVLFGVLFNYMINDCEVLTFSGTPTQLADVVEGGDVSCIHSMQKSYIVQGPGRKTSTMESRECFFAPPIDDTISVLNSARSDITQHPVKPGASVLPLTLERIRDAVAGKYINFLTRKAADNSVNVTNNDLDDELGYWMDLRGVWWSTTDQDADVDVANNIQERFSVGADNSTMTGGWIVPNHNQRPELKPLREKDLYCKGSDTRNTFWGEGQPLKFYDQDTKVGKAAKSYYGSIIDAENNQATKAKLEKIYAMRVAKEFKDYTTPWTDKLRYRFEKPDDIPSDFAPDIDDVEARVELRYPFATWNDGNVWLDQCELTTIEIDSTNKFMILGNEAALHLPIAGMETATFRNTASGLGFETFRALRPELKEPTLSATYDSCPHVVPTLGAAMGWVVLLEAAATLLFLGILMPTGVIQNDKAPFKTIIAQVLSEGVGGESGKTGKGKKGKDEEDGIDVKEVSTNAYDTVIQMQDMM